MEEFRRGCFEEGVAGVGGDLDEGFEDEGAFVHPGMGDDKVGLVDNAVAVQKEVEVERPGAPVFVSAAAETVLDDLEGAEESAGGEAGFDPGDGVEEAGLVGLADGGGIEEGADAEKAQARKFGEETEGGFEVGAAVAEVGAEGDVGGDGAP